jgi:hypothetical protein
MNYHKNPDNQRSVFPKNEGQGSSNLFPAN